MGSMWAAGGGGRRDCGKGALMLGRPPGCALLRNRIVKLRGKSAQGTTEAAVLNPVAPSVGRHEESPRTKYRQQSQFLH